MRLSASGPPLLLAEFSAFFGLLCQLDIFVLLQNVVSPILLVIVSESPKPHSFYRMLEKLQEEAGVGGVCSAVSGGLRMVRQALLFQLAYRIVKYQGADAGFGRANPDKMVVFCS